MGPDTIYAQYGASSVVLYTQHQHVIVTLKSGRLRVYTTFLDGS